MLMPILRVTAVIAIAGLACGSGLCGSATLDEHSAYLMAYFGPQEKLYYAYSIDARNWKALNGGEPVFDANARLRDPFINRAKGKFHLVHTKGWDHPTIFHWESTDLIDWKGGPIDVIGLEGKRAWAPEFYYSAGEDLFYVFWASIHEGHNALHYLTTRDWKDIKPDDSALYFDIGIHDIDLTIVEHGGTYYGFHKPGDVDDRMGNRLSKVTNLDPSRDSFAKDGHGKVVFQGETKPTEGPEVIKLIGEAKWYIYGDPFHAPMQAWETTDFVSFQEIAVSTPEGSKHCSMIPITRAELDALLERYPGSIDGAADPAKWKLVWSDEFDYEGLPDAVKWDYEVGFVRNKEEQYYTHARSENARVENGILVIEGRKERFANPAYEPGSGDWRKQNESASYTAASIVTRHKACWRYGRIEIRARLPHGKGIWPAIWTLGANRSKARWPRCGEIDIMEFVGKDPNRVHATVHFAGKGKHRSDGGKLQTSKPYADFHVYAIEWDEQRIDFFFDSTKYHTFLIDKAGAGEDNPFRKPHYLLINLALGGSWGGPIDDDVLPQRYLIDYVRIYETKTRSTEK